jgi:hypothetical protein
VVFAAGSSVDLIAGYSIQMEPGFHASSGSDVHVYITANSGYCMIPPGVATPGEAYKSMVVASTNAPPDEPPADQGLKIFPNPANGVVTIEVVNLERPALLSITDALGEVVFRSDLLPGAPARFDLSRFGKGLYVVRVNDGKSVITRKLIVQ